MLQRITVVPIAFASFLSSTPFLLQCVAVCCSALHGIVVCCSVLQYVAVCYNVAYRVPCVLQHRIIPRAVCGGVLQCVEVRCSALQYAAAYYS